MSSTTRSGQVPRWAQYTTLTLSIAAAAVASYLTFTHYSDPAALALLVQPAMVQAPLDAQLGEITTIRPKRGPGGGLLPDHRKRRHDQR